MKTIIVCYSHTGNNLVLAQYLQKSLGCDVEEVIEKRKRSRLTILLDIIFNRDPAIHPLTARLDNYDLAIFVAPVWSGRIATPVRTLLREQRAFLEAFAFITVCAGSPGQAEKIFGELSEVTHEEPVAVTELPLSMLFASPVAGLIDYRVKEADMTAFAPLIENFLKKVSTGLPAVTLLKEYDGIL